MVFTPFKIITFSLVVILYLGLFYFLRSESKPDPTPNKKVGVTKEQKVKYPQDYTIVMVGDSMTEALGNFTELKQYLSDYYKKSFEILNYGFGSTNILFVVDRITKETEHGRKFMPISNIDYDLILMESFGENPLSQYPLEEGLRRQNEELDKIVAILKKTNPKGRIVFVATISPNKVIFAKSKVDLTDEARVQWVKERIAYIQNHIDYANSHNIPVINIFKDSLMENGDGNPDYINTRDYIHPSPSGIIFISREIADFIYRNKIL